MSNKQYVKALNREIRELNRVIDYKIIHHDNCKMEARRHRKLLQEVRRHEIKKSFADLYRVFTPSWF